MSRWPRRFRRSTGREREARTSGEDGRDGGIRTHGPLTPSQVRYQAALHPDWCEIVGPPTGGRYALARRFDFPAALAAAFIVAGFALPADPAADRTARAGFLSFRCGIVRTEA